MNRKYLGRTPHRMFYCGAFRRRIVSNNQSFNVITLVSSRIRYAGSSSVVSHAAMLVSIIGSGWWIMQGEIFEWKQ